MIMPKEVRQRIEGTRKCNSVIFEAERKISDRLKCLTALNDILGCEHGNSISRLLWDVKQALEQIGEARKNYGKNCKVIEHELYHALVDKDSPNT